MMPETMLDRIAGHGSIAQKSFGLDKKKLMGLFDEMLSMPYQDFLVQHGELNNLEKTILLHLSHIHNDSHKTIKLYCSVLVDFFNYAGLSPEMITFASINDFINQLKNKKLAPNTINHKIAVIKSFFSFCHKTGMLPANPTATIKPVKGGGNKFQYKILSLDEIKRLCDYCRKNVSIRDYMIIRMICLTGIRTVELVNARYDHFFQNVQGSWFLTVYGKGSKQRDVYIPQALMDEMMIMREFYLNIPPYEYLKEFALPVFVGREQGLNKPLTDSSIYKIVSGLGQKVLKKNISPHWLRHSFATHARMKRENGKPASLEALQAQLGHQSINTTMKYDHSAHLSEPAGCAVEEIMGAEDKK